MRRYTVYTELASSIEVESPRTAGAFVSSNKVLCEMIDDDEDIARDDYRDYLIEQALRDELDELKRKGELSSTPALYAA